MKEVLSKWFENIGLRNFIVYISEIPLFFLKPKQFYKQYENYPVSLATGISLANLGNDFGAIGNEPLVSNGLGKALGMEFSVQQKLIKKLKPV